MPKTGVDLGASIFDLYRAGKHKIIPLADDFRTAGGDLSAVSDLSTLLMRSDGLSASYEVVTKAWASVRDDLADILSETSVNLEDTGEALVMAAKEYAETDDAARREYTRLRDIYEEGK